MVDRYSFNSAGEESVSDDGGYVAYGDYAELENHLEAETARANREHVRGFNMAMECVEELEKQRDGLVAELNAVEKIHTDAVFINDDDYDKCPDSVKKVISSLAVISLPASKVAIAEIGARAVEGFADCAYTLEEHDHAISYANKLRGGGV